MRSFETWIALGIILILWGVIHRKASPQVGYLLFLLVLVKAVLPFQIEIPYSFRSMVFNHYLDSAVSLRDYAFVQYQALPVPDEERIQLSPNGAKLQDRSKSTDSTSADAFQSYDQTESTESSLSWMSILMMAWIMIVSILLLSFFRSQWKMIGLIRTMKSSQSESPPFDVDAIRERLHIRKPVKMISTLWVRSPSVWGVFDPILLMPQNFFACFTENQVKWMLAHELVHIRRHDVLAALVQRMIQFVYFFNPAIWIANWYIDRQREFACDDMALIVAGASREECGDGFMKMLRQSNHAPEFLLSPIGFVRPKSLARRRMMRILDSKRKLRNGFSWISLMILLFACLIVFPMVRAAVDDSPSKEGIIPKTAAGISVKKLPSDYGFPSWDERYALCIPTKPHGLIVRELDTGKEHRLTEIADDSDLAHWHACLSPNGQQVVYNLLDGSNGTANVLYLASLADKQPRILYRNDDALRVYPMQWSIDGRLILACIVENDECTLTTFSVTDGSENRLLSFVSPNDPYGGFSPKADYVAYDFPQSPHASLTDIYLYSMKEKRSMPLIEHSADDKFLGWSPDGDWILFSSDRLGTQDAWILPISDGKREGSPQLIMRKIDGIDAHSGRLTKSGAFYYASQFKMYDVLLASLDVEKGGLLESFVPVYEKGYFKNNPRWSRDGRYVAFNNIREQENPTHTLCIQEMKTNKVRLINPEGLSSFGWMQWSSDNSHIVAVGTKKQEDRELYDIYQINVEDGSTKLLIDCDDDDVPTHLAYSPDHNSIYYLLKDKGRLVKYDLLSQNNENLYSHPNLRYLALSRNGDQLLVIMDDWDKYTSTIGLVPTNGGQFETIHEFKYTDLRNDLRYVGWVEWMPGGQELLLLKQHRHSEGASFWTIPLKGGAPRKLWDPGMMIYTFDIHPDGKQIAISSVIERDHEKWVMENIFPSE